MTYSLFFLLGKFSVRALFEIERKICQVLGKGSGSKSLSMEVKQLLGLWKELNPGKDNPTIFDVGANVGDFTALILEAFPISVVHSFEPSNSSHSLLTLRFQDNPRVVLNKMAITKTRGIASLFGNEHGSALSSLYHRDVQFADLSFRQLEKVETTTLESYFSETKSFPDILKLDVEGSELDVLQGAIALIKNISVVQFEFGGANRDSGTYFKDFWEYFELQDFRLYRLSPLGPISIPRYSEYDEFFHTSNYVAVNSKFYKPL